MMVSLLAIGLTARMNIYRVLMCTLLTVGTFSNIFLADEILQLPQELVAFTHQLNIYLCNGCKEDSPELDIIPLAVACCLGVILIIAMAIICWCIWKRGVPCLQTKARSGASKQEGIELKDTEPEERFEVHQQPVSDGNEGSDHGDDGDPDNDNDNDNDNSDDLDYAYAYGHEIRAPAGPQPGARNTYSNVNPDAMNNKARCWKTADREPAMRENDTTKNRNSEEDDNDEDDYVDPTEFDVIHYDYAYGHQLQVLKDPKTGESHSISTSDQRNTLSNSGVEDEQNSTAEREYVVSRDIPCSPGTRPLRSPYVKQRETIHHSYIDFEIKSKSSVPQQSCEYEVVDLQT